MPPTKTKAELQEQKNKVCAANLHETIRAGWLPLFYTLL